MLNVHAFLQSVEHIISLLLGLLHELFHLVINLILAHGARTGRLMISTFSGVRVGCRLLLKVFLFTFETLDEVDNPLLELLLISRKEKMVHAAPTFPPNCSLDRIPIAIAELVRQAE